MAQDYDLTFQAYMQIANQYTPEQVEKAATGMLIFLSNLAATAAPVQLPAVQLRYSIAQALRLSALRRLGHPVGWEENLNLLRDTAHQAAMGLKEAAEDVGNAASDIKDAVQDLADSKDY